MKKIVKSRLLTITLVFIILLLLFIACFNASIRSNYEYTQMYKLEDGYYFGGALNKMNSVDLVVKIENNTIKSIEILRPGAFDENFSQKAAQKAIKNILSNQSPVNYKEAFVRAVAGPEYEAGAVNMLYNNSYVDKKNSEVVYSAVNRALSKNGESLSFIPFDAAVPADINLEEMEYGTYVGRACPKDKYDERLTVLVKVKNHKLTSVDYILNISNIESANFDSIIDEMIKNNSVNAAPPDIDSESVEYVRTAVKAALTPNDIGNFRYYEVDET